MGVDQPRDDHVVARVDDFGVARRVGEVPADVDDLAVLDEDIPVLDIPDLLVEGDDGDAPPKEELDARIHQYLFGPGFEEFSHWDRMKVYHELFTHAQNDERHRETFNDHYG
ncbi:MAG: hypothetical protein ACOCSD_06665, partial [Halolamina sp.]